MQRPRNHSVSTWESFYFNCSTNGALASGIDWYVRLNGIHEGICQSFLFDKEVNYSCKYNYKVERPDNQTFNLVVEPQKASLGDLYCCRLYNEREDTACAFLTSYREFMALFFYDFLAPKILESICNTVYLQYTLRLTFIKSHI